MRKIWKSLLFSIAVMIVSGITVYASDLEYVGKDMVLETIEETLLYETPKEDTKETAVIPAQTPVLVIEAAENGWCKVTSQEQTGYVRISELKTLGNKDELDAEFDKVNQTVLLTFDEIITREKEARQARVWGTIIVVLVVAIFGVGILSAIRKNKLENERGRYQ